MTEWVVFWIITIHTYSGDVRTNYPMTKVVDNYTECIIEANAKNDQLNYNLGGEHYELDSGFKVPYGGKLIGFTVGCESRTVKTKIKYGF